jgi:hypothetical protein
MEPVMPRRAQPLERRLDRGDVARLDDLDRRSIEPRGGGTDRTGVVEQNERAVAADHYAADATGQGASATPSFAATASRVVAIRLRQGIAGREYRL